MFGSTEHLLQSLLKPVPVPDPDNLLFFFLLPGGSVFKLRIWDQAFEESSALLFDKSPGSAPTFRARSPLLNNLIAVYLFKIEKIRVLRSHVEDILSLRAHHVGTFRDRHTVEHIGNAGHYIRKCFRPAARKRGILYITSIKSFLYVAPSLLNCSYWVGKVHNRFRRVHYRPISAKNHIMYKTAPNVDAYEKVTICAFLFHLPVLLIHRSKKSQIPGEPAAAQRPLILSQTGHYNRPVKIFK